MEKIFNPKVSIIIPVFNGEKYMQCAIDSALNQTYKNIEIIVVNDGSTDRTDEIAKSYGDKIRYFSKENGGVSTALNLAISKMEGDYFSWLSHDDRYYPNKVESQIEYLKSLDSIDNIILYSDYDLMNNNSKVYATSIKEHKILVEKPEYALLRAEINGITLLIPKKAFDEFGVFDENLRCVQDYELWKRMQAKYIFLHQEGVLATTRIHEKQQGNTSPKMLTEGEPFWTDLFITSTPLETKIKLSGSEYSFYEEMSNLFISTPYKQTVAALKNKMEEAKQATKQLCPDIKVSVVIPFYNRSNVLLNAINSVINQTHNNIELLLIDDGSTDDLSEIKSFIKNNDKIKYIRIDENKGASHARNVGIKNASGKYIAFLDSDDTFLPEKIEKQLYEMVLGGYKFSHTSYIRKSPDNTEQIMNSGVLTGSAIPDIIAGCAIATPTIMIEKEYLTNNNFYYNENLDIGEDVCFYLIILKNIKILGIDQPLSIVNTNSSSASLNIEKQLIGLQTIIKYILNDADYSKYHYQISLLFNQYIGIASDLLVNTEVYLPDCANCKRIKNSLSWKITKPIRFIERCKNYINRTHYNNFKHDLKTYGVKYTIKKILKKFH